MTYVGEVYNATVGPSYTYFIRVDDSSSKDRTATYWGNLTEEIDRVCATLASHSILSHAPAVNAIGFSQGGQFLRAYIERCNDPPVRTLITFGSQHNGISEFQECGDFLCRVWEGFLKTQTWSQFSQSTLVPAQYYRNLADMEKYLEFSNFLADVNNEREVKNARYRENLKRLERFVMYMFEEDTTVVPKESAYFWDVDESGDERKVVELRDRRLYKEDWLGLRWLDERGRLQFKVAPGRHMQIDEPLLRDVFKTYLSSETERGSEEVVLAL